jgi:oligosaccharide repeat unit polymerase
VNGAYAGSDVGTNTENGIYFLVSHFVMIAFAVFIYYLAKKKNMPILLKTAFVISILWCFLLLIFGDRNTFFILAIILGGGYFTFVKRIKYLGLFGSIFLAISLYNVIEISRNSEERGIEAIANAITSTNEDTHSITEGSFNNTTITSRAVFSLVPDRHDYFLGKIKFIGFAGIVPFSRGLFVDKNDRYSTSADIITDGVLGPGSTWSLGSNIISDIYVDFGFSGVIILMLLMGGFAAFVQQKIIVNPHSLKWLVIYLIVLSLYSEAPRYSYDFSVRNIAWAVLLFWGYGKIFKNRDKSNV